MAEIRIGTSAFTAAGWAGSFYPKGMKSTEYLSFYATRFDAVELDNTFYAPPAVSTAKNWYAKTPPGFLFAAKVPQLCSDENYVAKRAERQCFLNCFRLRGPHNLTRLHGFRHSVWGAWNTPSTHMDDFCVHQAEQQRLGVIWFRQFAEFLWVRIYIRKKQVREVMRV
jgi:uncharacterized protein YecE (DUF72 family)